jgi:hypothetical protein
VAQDWSASPFFKEGASVDTTYVVLARCSSTPACTTTTGATQSILAYPGDGTDIQLDVVQLAPGNHVLRWNARPQPPSMSGYDVIRYTQPPAPPVNLAGAIQLGCAVGVGVPVGSQIQVTDLAIPALGTAFDYWVGHSGVPAGSRAALGRRSDNTIRIAPVGACP